MRRELVPLLHLVLQHGQNASVERSPRSKGLVLSQVIISGLIFCMGMCSFGGTTSLIVGANIIGLLGLDLGVCSNSLFTCQPLKRMRGNPCLGVENPFQLLHFC